MSDKNASVRLAPHKGRLAPETSCYLDIARLFAVALVLFSHAKRPEFGGRALATIGQYGQQGVAIFFVISGLVIAHVAITREMRLGSFVVARLSRLWSVAIPAVALTVVLDGIGRAISPALYDDPLVPAWQLDLPSLWRATSPILFVNHVPGLAVDVGSNGPFWSLGCEAFYYFAFAVLCVLRGPVALRVALAVVLAVLAGWPIVLLSPLWVAGNLFYPRLGSGRPSVAAWAIWIISGVLFLLSLLGSFRIIYWLSLGFSQAVAENLTVYFIPAALFCINLLSFDAIGGAFAAPFVMLRPAIRWLADRSFSIYLYQAPMMFFCGALTQDIQPRWFGCLLVVVPSIAAALALAEITEQQRARLSDLLMTFRSVASKNLGTRPRLSI